MLEQVGQQLDLRAVRRAHERGIVVGERYVLDPPVVGAVGHRVDAAGRLRAGDRQALAPLDPEADHDGLHAYCTRFSITASFSSTSSGVTGVLPSCSHATPAAIVARIEAMTGDPVARSESVA